MTGEIRGTGACVPQRIVENEELKQLVDTSDAWIRERTGIQRRHLAMEETTVSMAAKAAEQALRQADMKAEELDLILVSTMSPTDWMPCTACAVQREIGAVRAACFDLNAACSGFVIAYTTACAYIESGVFQRALVIGSECLSGLVDWSDRGTCILFGDGAGAVVLAAAEGKSFVPVLHSDGNQGAALTLRGRPVCSFLTKSQTDDRALSSYIQMNGQAVFKFAVRRVPQVIEEVLERNHMTREDIAYYVLHQANQRIVEVVAKWLGEPIEKFPMNIQEYGNTSSASIPILLNEMSRQQQLHSGEHVVLVGFGGGLTWGAVIVTWGQSLESKKDKNKKAEAETKQCGQN